MHLGKRTVYENLAIIAVFAFVYSAVAGRVEKSVISGPMVFIVFGLLMGSKGLGILDLEVGNTDLRILADLTLAMTVVCTVILSVIAHGLTANPLASAYAKKIAQAAK